MNDYQKYFEENGYVIISGVLDESSLMLAYHYAKIKVQASSFKYLHRSSV